MYISVDFAHHGMCRYGGMILCMHYLPISHKKDARLKLLSYQPRVTVNVCFGLQSYQGLKIERSLLYKSYPRDRINTQVIY